jgi:hypothetical protein
MYTWTCHKETHYVVSLNQQKYHRIFFYKIKEQEGGTGPAWGTGTSGSGEKVWESEYGANIVYTCM